MKLKVFDRKAETKGEAKRIRREGNIPAVMYDKQGGPKHFAVSGPDYEAVIRQVPKGRLSTSILTLVDEKGHEIRCILKDIQYHITTYRVNHLDFEKLDEKTTVNVNVPIEFVGVADCVGTKLGGVLRQVIRSLRVKCLPKDIPGSFRLDVSKMTMNQSKRLSELDIPPTLRPLADLNEVTVTIGKR